LCKGGVEVTTMIRGYERRLVHPPLRQTLRMSINTQVAVDADVVIAYFGVGNIGPELMPKMILHEPSGAPRP
jgi:hypothetical protein